MLRVHPEDDGTYTIPEGNLFAPGTEKTLPEIYAMGFRNPFRFTIDPKTGYLGVADYSPDNGSDNPANRGPAGIAEWNLIKEPGFFGWPLCMGNNEPFRDVDYRTSPVTVGGFFDCDAPVNDSVKNTGLTELPAAQPADLWYGYQRSSVPGVINAGGGLAPMGGPFYEYDPELDSDTKFPSSYDGKAFFYEWARNKMYTIDLKDPEAAAGVTDVEKVNPSSRRSSSSRRSTRSSAPTARCTCSTGAAASAVTTRTRACTASTTCRARARRCRSRSRRRTPASRRSRCRSTGPGAPTPRARRSRTRGTSTVTARRTRRPPPRATPTRRTASTTPASR